MCRRVGALEMVTSNAVCASFKMGRPASACCALRCWARLRFTLSPSLSLAPTSTSLHIPGDDILPPKIVSLGDLRSLGRYHLSRSPPRLPLTAPTSVQCPSFAPLGYCAFSVRYMLDRRPQQSIGAGHNRYLPLVHLIFFAFVLLQ